MISRSRHPFVDQTSQLRSAIAIATWLIPIVGLGCIGWMVSSFLLDQQRCDQLTSSDPDLRRSMVTKKASPTENTVASRERAVWDRKWQAGSSLRASKSAMSEQPAASTAVPDPSKDAQRVMELDFGLRLIGTFVEKDRALGLAVATSGTLTYFRGGQVLDLNGKKVEIQKVRIEGVTVAYENQSVDWHLGQSLKVASLQLQSEKMQTPFQNIQAPPQTVEPGIPTPIQTKPSMDLNRELEFLNGSNGEPPSS